MAERDDRRPRAHLHEGRLRRPRPAAPPRVLGRHARGVPARGRPLPRPRHPHRGRAVQARDRAGLLPLRDRARRQPHRGHDRRLLRVRPGPPADGVDRGGAQEGPGVGREDGRELPHVRHAAGRGADGELTGAGGVGRDARPTRARPARRPSGRRRARAPAPRTARVGQALRAEDDERDRQDDDQFHGADAGHGLADDVLSSRSSRVARVGHAQSPDRITRPVGPRTPAA